MEGAALGSPYSAREDGNYYGELINFYKAEGEAQRKTEQEEYNRAKGTVSSLIDSYHKAESQTLQEDIINMMKTYTSALPTHLKAAVEPYIRHGPTSATAEKRRQFEQQFKRPEPPVLNEASGEAAEQENKQALANYWFRNADWEHGLKVFMLGAEAAGDKPTFFSFTDGSGVVRDKSGQIRFLGKQDMALDELEKLTGIPKREMILNPEGIPTGKKSFINQNGRQIQYEQVLKPFAPEEERYGYRIADIQAIPKSALDEQLPAELTKFLLHWKEEEPKESYIKDFKERLNKAKDTSPRELNKVSREVADELAEVFKGYSFEIHKQDKPEPWWAYIPFISADGNYVIQPIKGVPIALTDAAGKAYVYYYDSAADMVYDTAGQPKGSLQQVEAEVKSKTIKLK